jgi:hypothetical protein
MNPITYITFLIDKSLSMEKFRSKLPEVYRGLLANIKANAGEQDIRVRVLQFGSSVPLSDVTYQPIRTGYFEFYYSPTEGSTKLNDAMIKALEKLPYSTAKPPIVGSTRALLNPPQPAQNANEASLLVVLTDGEENASAHYPAAVRAAAARHGDLLTIALNVPPMSEGKLIALATNYGVPRENISVWEQSIQGIETMARVNESATTSYITSTRGQGLTKSVAFYAHTPDLTGFDPKTADLANLHGKFMSRRIHKEERIDEFVQRETGQPYLRGMAFYQLTKPETIQGNKDILLREKGKVTVWGGPNARKAIGLQAFKDGKITPGNHANWDIFVQSLADNRKLVRGTDLLIRK